MPETNTEAVSADDIQRIRTELGSLVRYGAESWWIAEQAPTLTHLELVTHQLHQSGGLSDNDYEDLERRAAALRDVLAEATGLLPPADRRILNIVLALDGKYAGVSAQERRAEAGRVFRDGRRQVTWATIRQYHEPKALDALTRRLVERELEYRRQRPDT